MIHALLKLLPPERAHAIAKFAMARGWRAPGEYVTARARVLFGNILRNPLGLAAGFDKNGELPGTIHDYGFGFLEVGSVTRNGGAGNAKPRLFRLPEGGILNRMGLNGDPAFVVAARLKKIQENAPMLPPLHYGINIAKTHDPDIMGDMSIYDICFTYELLKEFGMYHVINISCPNTREGRTFENPGALRELLQTLKKYRPFKNSKPVLVKLSPGLATDRVGLEGVIHICEDHGIDGYICCNTIPTEHPRFGRGGLSGPAVRNASLRLITRLRQDFKIKSPIIGCGGVGSDVHMRMYDDVGATVVQAYSGFTSGRLGGPEFAWNVLAEYEACMPPFYNSRSVSAKCCKDAADGFLEK